MYVFGIFLCCVFVVDMLGVVMMYLGYYNLLVMNMLVIMVYM